VTVTDVPTSTPEPGVRSLMLMGLMSLGLVLAMRKRAVLGLPKAT
jgi:MYXO-CTERM domain-containing protein